ncbi:hypothetical protein Psta_0551 [Pirellula staleyi DSM 6068]|uniref:Uncharacterized protein n=1 Tax=Pirellula staleyi (strain ATCC 27377 / DSM 6068 / ICPB 4128) TaxID=530564 RepID=D2R490_PIRSD|nr:hypothetical protein [Pirellula staleyi]ADB15238.1 hypothetical protein Psta_0551 [Pirellula staleyi DSM 6068]
MSQKPTSGDSPATKSEPSIVRSLVSLAIVIHFICVGVVLASNLRRSPLQSRLVDIFGSYTQTFNFDPDFTPYYYTFGRPMDDDSVIEIDLYPSGDEPLAGQEKIKTVVLPEAGSGLLGDKQRHLAIARVLAFHAMPDIEAVDVTSEIAKAVGVRVMLENGARRAVVRCVQRMSQPADLADLQPGFPPNDPTAAPYNVTVYEADVWILENGTAGTLPRAARGEVAPGRTPPPASSSSGARPSSTPAPPKTSGGNSGSDSSSKSAPPATSNTSPSSEPKN